MYTIRVLNTLKAEVLFITELIEMHLLLNLIELMQYQIIQTISIIRANMIIKI